MAAPMPMAIEMRGFKEKVERGRCSTLKFKTERKKQNVVWQSDSFTVVAFFF